MANEIEEANALTRQALELAGREQDMLERAHPSADTHEFIWSDVKADNIAPSGSRWFLVTLLPEGSTTNPGLLWARKKERQEDGK